MSTSRPKDRVTNLICDMFRAKGASRGLDV